MKIILAPDSFKGSMTSEQIIEILKEEAEHVLGPCECIGVPMADGGEGTIDAIVSALHGIKKTLKVHGPLGALTPAEYGVIGTDTAVIEMAQASGLTLIPAEKRNPLETSSQGTGELIRHVLEQGIRNIYLTVGGSATNDGGMGAADALGIEFYDSAGRRLQPAGKSLAKVESVSVRNMIPQLEEAKITIMCDVRNPLLGPQGTAYVYSAQKGADAHQRDELEAGMTHYAERIRAQFGVSLDGVEGLGAAGGVCVPFTVWANAELNSGIDSILKLIRFDEMLQDADLVVTGEGRADAQSVCGKVLSGIGKMCLAHHVPAAAVVGGMGEGAEQLYPCGISSIMTTVNAPMSLNDAMEHSAELIRSAAERMFRLIRIGTEMQKCIYDKNGRNYQ